MDRKNKTRKKRSKKKRWSMKRKIIISSISIFILIIGILASGYIYVRSKIYSEINISNKTQDTEYKEVEGITNVLLIGTDGRTLDESARADSIIIATLDNNNKNIKLTSLFRDTLVNIPGHGEAKLNAAMAYGGVELLIETIKNTYGISLDKYVIINFWGFEAIIDQIGGLEFNVENYMLNELNKYIGESTGGNDCPVTEPGVQILNGKQALSYARIRKGVGDEFARTDRQREVLVKVAEKLKETKPSKYLGIMNSMLNYIKTNIDPIQALNMAYTIYKFPNLDIKQLQIPIPELTDGRLFKNLGWVFLMDTEQNSKYLTEFIFENKVPDSSTYDYKSFNKAMAEYKEEENEYNQKHNINPKDYENTHDDNVAKPSTSNNKKNNSNSNNSSGNISNGNSSNGNSSNGNTSNGSSSNGSSSNGNNSSGNNSSGSSSNGNASNGNSSSGSSSNGNSSNGNNSSGSNENSNNNKNPEGNDKNNSGEKEPDKNLENNTDNKKE